MKRKVLLATCIFPVVLSLATPARASFHFMQIEQVIGGVCGDTTSQAIQLRMRGSGQNLVNTRRLIAYDSTGANPVVLITFPSNVGGSSLGARILVTSAAFSSANSPTPDFTLTNLIPASYLAAGRLVFEDGFGVIYWSLSWGGASYTGSTTGSTLNDADGNFGPSFAGPLPTSSNLALQFQGLASALSTNNAANYSLTSAAAVFTNNSSVAGTVLDSCLFGDGFESGDVAVWSSVVP